VRPVELAEDVPLSTKNSSPEIDAMIKKSRPTIAERLLSYQEKTPLDDSLSNLNKRL
jgi:hypothetical protein